MVLFSKGALREPAVLVLLDHFKPVLPRHVGSLEKPSGWRNSPQLSQAPVVGRLLLNLCYGVTVKIGSIHLLGMALLVLAADARRLIGLFVLDLPAAAPALPRAPMGRAATGLKVFFVGCSLYPALFTEAGTGSRLC
jgi:hypothetical protein